MADKVIRRATISAQTSLTPETILKSVFGYDAFKPLQGEIIENVLHKRDTLAVMPTGGGKSLCYQIPALIFPNLTVVVSPLISLMKDQVDQLSELGVTALYLNSSLGWEEYQANIKRVRSHDAKLLYVSPETLLSERIQQLLEEVSLDCLTVDEAHCISEWGHDFRPEYRQLAGVRERFPEATCLALTASATQRVREDIRSSLRFDGTNEFIASFNRPNLMIEVVPKRQPPQQTIKFLERFPKQAGIIYCFSRQQVDELTAFLQERGFLTRPYHAGLPEEQRRSNQEAFSRDDVQIIVATIAFGMGINKSNVRFILHYDLPKSIESYYHEIGRAGRDGLPAYCQLLYSYGDVQKIKFLIEKNEGIEKEIGTTHLAAMVKYAESDICRRTPLLAYFGETFTTDHCGMCDNCLAGQKEQVDITVPAQKFLSCIKRTGEMFGASHVVDVLLGSESQKVLKHGHQNLSTYGIGKELTHKQWLHIGRQLVVKGLITQEQRYGSLKLTEAGYQSLKSRQAILGRLQEAERPVELAMEVKAEYEVELFKILRAKRKELAEMAHVPPYVVFSDKTLVEMATYLPDTPGRMKSIYGMGERKFEKYGIIFMELISSYCRAHQLIPRPKPGKGPGSKKAKPDKKSRHIEVGEMYNEGQTIEQIMAAFGIQQRTVLFHFYKFLSEGRALRPLEDLPEPEISAEQQQLALRTFTDLGSEYLKSVFDALGGEVSYDDLQIIRLRYLTQESGDGFPP